jgi:hypothetical protein
MEIHYNNAIEERFIPLGYRDLLDDYLTHFPPQAPISSYYQLLEQIDQFYYHHFYTTQEAIKESYAPFNPDSDLLLQPLPQERLSDNEAKLFEHIESLLNHANYEPLNKTLLEERMNRTSPYGVEVSVDFEDFEKIALYYRGESIQKEQKKDPKRLYLKTTTLTEPLYRRLFIVVKPKNIDQRVDEIVQKSGKDPKRTRKKLQKKGVVCDKERPYIYVKLFKDIPQSDLEMLFPNTKIKMRLFDKLKLAIVGGGGTIGGGSTLFTKLSVAAIEPLSALLALGAFVGVLWRQVKEVLFRRTHYMAQLANNLYFHNLSNNASTLNHMVSLAKEEEVKEALLVYLFLHHQSTPIAIEALDSEIEAYIQHRYALHIDFEVADGVRKLRELGVLVTDGEEVSVVGVQEALRRLSSTEVSS